MRDSPPCSSPCQLGFCCSVFWRSASGFRVLLVLKCCSPCSCWALPELSTTGRKLGIEVSWGQSQVILKREGGMMCTGKRFVWCGTSAYVCPLRWHLLALGNRPVTQAPGSQWECLTGLVKAWWKGPGVSDVPLYRQSDRVCSGQALRGWWDLLWLLGHMQDESSR